MNRHLFLLLVIYLFFAAAYSLLVPPWEAPDETAHYLAVEYVAREGEMPTFEESYEAVQPPGYYWIAGSLFRIVESVDSRLTARRRPPLTPQSDFTRYGWTAQNYRFQWAMQFLRWFNVVLGAVTLIFVYRGAQRLLGAADRAPGISTPSPLAAVALVALTPQFLHNSASVSNDALANACGALLFWILVASALQPPSPWLLSAATLAAVGLPFLVKLTLLPLSVSLLLVLGWRAWRLHRRLFLSAMVTSIVVLSTGLVLVAPASARFLSRTLWWRLTFIRPDILEGWSLTQILAYYGAGYWGQIGWKFASLPVWLWGLLWVLTGLGGIASLRLLLRHWSERRFWGTMVLGGFLVTVAGGLLQSPGAWWQLPWILPIAYWLILLLGWLGLHTDKWAHQLRLPVTGWRAVWLAATLAFVMVARNALTTPQFQARFLFPALGPIAVITIVGWWMLLPPKSRRWLTPALVITFAAVNLFFWLDTVVPVFFQPFLDG